MSVTAPEILCKQPWEERRLTMYFTNLLDTAEKVSSIVSINIEEEGGGISDVVLWGSGVNADGKSIYMWAKEGTHKHRYRVQARIQSDGQQKLEGDGILIVSDS